MSDRAAPALSSEENPVLNFFKKVANSNVSFDFSYIQASGAGFKLMERGNFDSDRFAPGYYEIGASAGNCEPDYELLETGCSLILQGESYYMEGYCWGGDPISGGGISRVWCDGSDIWLMDVKANEMLVEPAVFLGRMGYQPILLLLVDCRDLYTWDKKGVPANFDGVACMEYSLRPKQGVDQYQPFDDITLYLDGDWLVGAVMKCDDATFAFKVSNFCLRPKDNNAVFAPESIPVDCRVTDLRN